MIHDTQDLEYLKSRGRHIQGILNKLKVWFTKNPYPIELRKVAYTYAAGAKKFGGIMEILSELEADGILRIDMIETKNGLVQTLMLTGYEKRRTGT